MNSLIEVSPGTIMKLGVANILRNSISDVKQAKNSDDMIAVLGTGTLLYILAKVKR